MATSSTTVFLQSNQLTTTLKLKLSPPEEPNPSPPPSSQEFGNWGFLHTGNYVDTSYSASKPCFSLELCTENLGSETGSDIVTDGDSIFSCSPPLSPSSDYSSTEFATSNYVRNYHHSWSRKGKEFPPPLTTMTGSSSLRVQRHTAEGGRLIIEAVETPFRNSYLQAERSDGRLRMCFVTDAEEPSCSTDAAGEEEEEEEEEEEIDDGEMAGPEEESATEFELEEEEFNGDQNQNHNQINREMGMEKLQRPSRCKDGSHRQESGLCCNWKPWLRVIST